MPRRAVAFASLQIQVQPIDPQPIGHGLGPIHVAHDRRTFSRAEVAQGPQPGIEIELPAEVGEAMIAHHHDGRPAAVAILDVADDLVEPLV